MKTVFRYQVKEGDYIYGGIDWNIMKQKYIEKVVKVDDIDNEFLGDYEFGFSTDNNVLYWWTEESKENLPVMILEEDELALLNLQS